MIINAEHSSIELRGDITEFKTGIDPKNLEFITTLLSSNLYSAPEQSFIREIVSNAWDSHVEAGTTDTPVILKFNIEDRSITIRDFGTGLSPERFKEVYCNIGSSTKRESNDFIGGFGIGKYSSLAVSDTVYITSFYEGNAYYYIMVKSGNAITTNLVAEIPTTEKNGVEVTIKDVKNLYTYKQALEYIVFFPNVYIDGPSDYQSIVNDVKIKKFKKFWVSSVPVRHRLLLGNVLYPIDANSFGHVGNEVRELLRRINSTGIVLKFDVGEIGITPNRENIIYTPETIKVITKRILEAKQEMMEEIGKGIIGDFDDIYKYINAIDDTLYYDFIKSEVNYNGYPYGLFAFNALDIPNLSITFKGKKRNDNRVLIRFCKLIGGAIIPNLRGIIYNDRFYTSKFPYGAYDYKFVHNRTVTHTPVILLKGGERLTAIAKEYLKETYGDCAVATSFTENDFSLYVKENLKHCVELQYPDADFYTTEIYKSFIKRTKVFDIHNDAQFLLYKDAHKTVKSVPQIKNVILYEWKRPSDRACWVRKYKLEYPTLDAAISYIKKCKSGVLIEGIDTNNEYFAELAGAKNYRFITCNKEVLKALESITFTNKIDKSWLAIKDPTLKKLHTLLESDIVLNPMVYETLPIPLRNEFVELHKLVKRYSEWSKYIHHSRHVVKEGDAYTKYLCDKYIKYKESWDIANTLVRESGGVSIGNCDLTIAVINKKKLYRVDYVLYKSMKRNKLIKALCRK